VHLFRSTGVVGTARAACDQAVARGTGRGTGWRRDPAHEWRTQQPGRHASGRCRQPAAVQHLHEPFPEALRLTGRDDVFQARIISYADDFVILGRDHATEALAWTRSVMMRLGLTLNEAKTSVKDARQESFDFLGYTFGPHRFRKDGHWYLGASPSKKSGRRLKAKVGDLLVPGNKGAWPKVCNQLNRLLRGWSSYFDYGTRLQAYRAVDNHVYESVRHFLVRRHNVQGRGTRRFPYTDVFGPMGVLHLRRVHVGPPPWASR